MLRLLNFISREDDLIDDKSVSEDGSRVHHLDASHSLSSSPAQHPNHAEPLPPAADNEQLLTNSLQSSKHPPHVHTPSPDITHNQTLTDSAIINQTSQVSTPNPDQSEPSDAASPTHDGHTLSHSHSSEAREEQFATDSAPPRPHLSSFSNEQPTPTISELRASSHDAVVEQVKPVQSPHACTNDIRTSPKARLYHAVHHLTRFAQLDLQQLNVESAQLCSFEQLQNALIELAQVMVWADQHEPALWDMFLELCTMPLLVSCLHKTQHLNKFRNERLANSSAHDDDSENAMPGNTALAPEDSNASDAAERPPTKEKFVNDNETEIASAAPASREDDEELHEGHTGSTTSDERTNGDMAHNGFIMDWDEFAPSKVQSQVLHTISIMVQSVSRRHSLLCLFSSGHINAVLSFDFSFDEEMIAAFISTVKTITIRLDRDLLQLFFDPVRNSFPLYDAVTKFYGHHESMVRIAIRNITLALYATGDPEVLKYAARDEQNYFLNIIHFLSRICGSVARAFELLLDDGREVRRTRTRTGIFRRKVRVSDVTDRLEEIENICSYLNDVCVISKDILCPVLVRLTSARFISPFFRPLASLASPEAVRARNKLWRLGNRPKKTSHKTALAVFDAAARCLLLSYILKSFRSSPMCESVTRELCRVSNDFDRRNVLHALKAMASDIAGTERATFVSLCTIEALIECKSVEKHFLHDFKYDFRVEDPNRNGGDELSSPRLSFLDLEAPHRDDLERSHDEPMLMTLSEFEAPLTPSNSLPSTPDLRTASSDGTITPSALSRATSSASLSSELSTSIAERTDSEGILFSFQMGEATLREALSSIVLVVRRREVRSMRVLYAISRIIAAIGAKTQEPGLCVEVCKIVVDELAGLMRSVLRDKRTTIVSIERMFESFRTAASSNQGMYSDAPKLEDVLSPDRAPLMASMFPKGAGKRRRALFDDAILPTEIEDADAFFVMMYAYERALTDAGITSLPKLVMQAQGILLEYDLPDSYLDKRDALVSFAEAVLQHGEIE